MYYLIQPYKMGSQSAKLLAKALPVCKRININANTYVPKAHHFVINWGSHKCYNNVTYLNHPSSVVKAANKLSTFKAFEANKVPTVKWTSSKEEAAKWISNGSVVLARTLLNASEGMGVVICEKTDQLPNAKLYTEYKKKKYEFRVHVLDGKVIDVQQKRKSKSYDGEKNQYIRSYRFGWRFCRQDIQEPDELRSVAIQAVKALELNFGAVDIIYNALENKCYVLEVNTAPGLEGSSVEIYAKAIYAYLQEKLNAKKPTNQKGKTTFTV